MVQLEGSEAQLINALALSLKQPHRLQVAQLQAPDALEPRFGDMPHYRADPRVIYTMAKLRGGGVDGPPLAGNWSVPFRRRS